MSAKVGERVYVSPAKRRPPQAPSPNVPFAEYHGHEDTAPLLSSHASPALPTRHAPPQPQPQPLATVDEAHGSHLHDSAPHHRRDSMTYSSPPFATGDPPLPETMAAAVAGDPRFSAALTFGQHHRRRQVELDSQVNAMRHSQSMKEALQQQMSLNEARRRREQDLERQRSRELLASGWKQGTTDLQDGESATRVAQPLPMPSDHTAGGIATVSSPQVRVSPERGGGRVSPTALLDGPRSKRASPERGKEIGEWSMVSPTKLFDIDQRLLQEERQRQQRQKQVDDHRAALDKQIRDREDRRKAERDENLRLDALMEERALREAAQLAEQEHQRQLDAQRLEQEAKAANRTVADSGPVPPSPAPTHGASVASRLRHGRRSSGQPDAGAHLPPPPARNSPQRILIRDEGVQVDERMLRGHNGDAEDNEVDLTSPNQRMHPPRFTPPPRKGMLGASELFPFANQPDAVPFPDEATLILQRNRDRLHALRFAGSHDDILKAFLMQESTAAIRSVARFRESSLSSS